MGPYRLTGRLGRGGVFLGRSVGGRLVAVKVKHRLFSSGPLGADLVDKDGKNVVEVSRPREFDELAKLLRPRGEQVFFGAYDPDAPPVGLGERFVKHLPAARAAIPAGDFRDWPAIDAWAVQIAAELRAGEPRGE